MGGLEVNHDLHQQQPSRLLPAGGKATGRGQRQVARVRGPSGPRRDHADGKATADTRVDLVIRADVEDKKEPHKIRQQRTPSRAVLKATAHAPRWR